VVRKKSTTNAATFFAIPAACDTRKLLRAFPAFIAMAAMSMFHDSSIGMTVLDARAGVEAFSLSKNCCNWPLATNSLLLWYSATDSFARRRMTNTVGTMTTRITTVVKQNAARLLRPRNAEVRRACSG